MNDHSFANVENKSIQPTSTTKTKLSEQLENELQLSKINRANIEAHWIQVLRKEKQNELKGTVQVLMEEHEKLLKQKDKIIDLLHVNHDHSETEFQTVFATHCDNINSMIDLYDERLLMMEKKFQSDLKTLQHQSKMERSRIIENHTKIDKKQLTDIIEGIEKESIENQEKEERDHQHLIQEIRNRNLEEINGLRVILESKIEDLDEQFEAAHGDYVQNTDTNASEYQVLTQREKYAKKEIDFKSRNIDRVQGTLQELRSKCSKNTKETNEKYDAIVHKKTIILSKYKKLKSEMNKFRNIQQQKLTELSINANKRKEELQQLLHIADRIFKISTLNEKMEKDHEYVLPLLENQFDKDLKQQAMRMMNSCRGSSKLCKSMITRCQNGVLISNFLENFWKKYNNVLLDVLSMEEKESKLYDERCQLKVSLGIIINIYIFFMYFNSCYRLYKKLDLEETERIYGWRFS